MHCVTGVALLLQMSLEGEPGLGWGRGAGVEAPGPLVAESCCCAPRLPTVSQPSPLADVKPSNVLINALGQVKMCDFGISGYLVDSVAKTIDAGCKPYMAVSTAPGVGIGSAAAFKSCQETRPGRPRREH